MIGSALGLKSSKASIQSQLDNFSIMASALKATVDPVRAAEPAPTAIAIAAQPQSLDDFISSLDPPQNTTGAPAALASTATATAAPKHLQEGEETSSLWVIFLSIVCLAIVGGIGYVYYRYTQWVPRVRSPSAKTGYRALAQAKADGSGHSTDEAGSARPSLTAAETPDQTAISPRTSKYKTRRVENLPAAP